MAIITDQRSYNYRNPAVIAVSRWLDAKYKSIGTSDMTASEKELALYRFAPVSLSDIWVERAVPTTENNGKALVSFAIRKRGYAVLDAVVDMISFNDVINHYKIPIKQFQRYQDLFVYLKSNKTFALYKVAESQSNKYGLLDDTSLGMPERFGSFVSALSDVKMDAIASYQDLDVSLTNPVVGSLALSHGTLRPFTVELYHYRDILALQM